MMLSDCNVVREWINREGLRGRRQSDAFHGKKGSRERMRLQLSVKKRTNI